MLTKEEKLVILIEEAGEVVKAATKCIRFGWVGGNVDYGVNHEVLAAEIGDLLGMADSLGLDWDIVDNYRRNKLAKATYAKAKFGLTKITG